MPTKKKTSKTTVSKQSTELSYETKMVIVIICLLFVYPVGLILMWFWMREWPLWVKLLISLPLFLGVLFFIIGIVLIGIFIGHARINMQREQIRERMLQQRQEMQIRPMTSITPTETTTSPTSPNTY